MVSSLACKISEQHLLPGLCESYCAWNGLAHLWIQIHAFSNSGSNSFLPLFSSLETKQKSICKLQLLIVWSPKRSWRVPSKTKTSFNVLCSLYILHYRLELSNNLKSRTVIAHKLLSGISVQRNILKQLIAHVLRNSDHRTTSIDFNVDRLLIHQNLHFHRGRNFKLVDLKWFIFGSRLSFEDFLSFDGHIFAKCNSCAMIYLKSPAMITFATRVAFCFTPPLPRLLLRLNFMGFPKLDSLFTAVIKYCPKLTKLDTKNSRWFMADYVAKTKVSIDKV